MEWDYRVIVERVGRSVEIVGVTIIVLGLFYATWRFVQTIQDTPFATQYRIFRRSLGRSILLGLEFLVAGDIISTVTVATSCSRPMNAVSGAGRGVAIASWCGSGTRGER